MKRLLDFRNRIKARKPRYRRQDSHKKARLKEAWRKPKGSDSKMRRRLRGYLKSPEIGYGSPKEVKGMTRDGYIPVNVNCMQDIEKIDKKKEKAVLGAHLGKKKAIAIIRELLKRKILIHNIKDPEGFIKKTEDTLKKKKEKKEMNQKAKEKKKKELEKKKKEEEKKELEERVGKEEEEKDHKKKEIMEQEKRITKKD